jgi:hypothetical protein
MKKIQILMLAAFAVFAISAVASGTAFAESELLLNGEPVKVGDEILGESAALVLTDLTSLGSATVSCSGFLHGTISSVVPNDLLITEVLDLENKLVSSTPLTGLALSCAGSGLCVGLAEVWPENLPWLAEIILSGTTFLFHLTEDGFGFPAYDVLCTNSFGLMSDDLCEGLASGVLENMAGENDVLGIFSLAEQEAEKELATCETGGAEKGHISGEFLLFEEGFTLAVS